MRRLLLLVTMAAMLAGAAPAPASDAQLGREIGRAVDKFGYITHRLDPERPRTFGRFAARLARAAKLAGHRIAHLQPSSKDGAAAKHAAVVALREIRIGARQMLIGINFAWENVLEAGALRMGFGVSALAFSLLGLS